MTREEFIKQRCEIDKITEEVFEKNYRVVECNCGQLYCKGYRCLDLDDLLKENQELKKHLKVPETCNLKTLEDYKSYYEDTTREQILADTYIEYCAYVNLAHRYSELEKQLEDMTLCRDIASGHREEVQDRETILLIQQKKFIKHLEDKIKNINKTESHLYQNKIPKYFELGIVKGEKYATKEILQRFKEITGTTNEQN